MISFIIPAFIFIILAVGIVVAVFGIKDTIKNIGDGVKLAREETSHFTGENTQNQGQHWMKVKWFAIGAVTMFLCAKIFSFFIIPLISSIVLQAVIVFFVTRKDQENKSAKRKFYALGFFTAILAIILILLIQFGGSKNPASILFHFVLLIALFILMAFANSKIKVLKNDTATRRTSGRITSHRISKRKILFFTYATSHIYEYEFEANGTSYRGIDGESNRQLKKRGSQLTQTTTVEYEADSPKNSWLLDIKHRGSFTVFAATIVCTAAIIAHCLMTTDLLEIIKNL
ncbi:MAG: hypothetical protein J5817_05310 [Treponema sp.]|nr:hypothetical protein [Treponema sp.]